MATSSLEIKTGEGPWRVTYRDGQVVMIEAWELSDNGDIHAKHVLRKSSSVAIIHPDPDR